MRVHKVAYKVQQADRGHVYIDVEPPEPGAMLHFIDWPITNDNWPAHVTWLVDDGDGG